MRYGNTESEGEVGMISIHSEMTVYCLPGQNLMYSQKTQSLLTKS